MAVARVTDTMSPAESGKRDASVNVKGISRREFLNYVWGASVALLAVEACGAATWFAIPSPLYNVKGGLFKIYPQTLPVPGSSPLANGAGEFWLTNSTHGLLALNMNCPFRGCRVIWVPANHRFECLCCGSKFTFEGQKQIGGPARRGLDRYLIHVVTPNRMIDTSDSGDPISIQDATYIIVDERKLILGKATV